MEDKYKHYNAMLVKECVQFYNKCWKDRCNLIADNKHQKDVLLLEVQKIMEQYDNTTNTEIRSYIRQKPSNMSVKTNEYIAQWIRGFNYMRRNAPRFNPGDIRDFFSTTINDPNPS